jgi:hypothetical protein
MIRNVCLLAALLVCLALPSTSNAYWPYWGFAGYGGYGWGFNQATNYVPSPPYYAIYPPVYYSPFITARQYGASPYAWYPGMHPVNYAEGEGAPAPDPVIIENPFVKGAKTTSKSAEASKIVVQPLKIHNPYVVRTSR